MRLFEYARYDALGLAGLVATKRVTPREPAQAAAAAVSAVNSAVNVVVETYADRIDDLDERTLGTGPLRGVPFLRKDFFGHEAGRVVEFGRQTAAATGVRARRGAAVGGTRAAAARRAGPFGPAADDNGVNRD